MSSVHSRPAELQNNQSYFKRNNAHDVRVDVYTVQNAMRLKDLAKQLYEGDLENAHAKEFLRVNQMIFGENAVLHVGMTAFIPAGYSRADEPLLVRVLQKVNNETVRELPLLDRQFLAKNQQVLDVIASEPKLAKTNGGVLLNWAGSANSVAAGVITGIDVQQKLMARTLRNLESHYANSIRAHGKLTPQFYNARSRFYAELDTAGGRIARSLSGLPASEHAKKALKISTKSQVLHWKRNGIDDSVTGFAKHFENMAKVAKYTKATGYVVVAFDGVLTAKTIHQICTAEEATRAECVRAGVVGGAGFVGSTGGGIGGGALAYSACNALFAFPSGGSSLLWCGLVAGSIGGYVGGKVGNSGMKMLTTKVYNLVSPR